VQACQNCTVPLTEHQDTFSLNFPMNKAEFVEKLSEKVRCSKTQIETLLDATLDLIQKTVSKGEEVKLVGFGSFIRTERKARPGRNPKTGEYAEIPGMPVPRFKPGKEFRTRVSKKS
jgi:DNA-binding protein HU-beta